MQGWCYRNGAGKIGAGGIRRIETVGQMNRDQDSGRVAPGEMAIKAATGSPACTSIDILQEIGNTTSRQNFSWLVVCKFLEPLTDRVASSIPG